MSSLSDPQSQNRKLDFVAALLSYLLPGLGQVLQGRVGKGLLFFVSLYGLFFFGMWMGQMRNVWLPNVADAKFPDVALPLVGKTTGAIKAISYRPQFLGQFWIGVAAWPAIVQYAVYPADRDPDAADPPPLAPVIGRYMQAPSEAELNRLQRDGDKQWDLGWVYTVIAGVLNILVIYDALAGPMIRDDQPWPGSLAVVVRGTGAVTVAATEARQS